jgi:hypothetical protein
MLSHLMNDTLRRAPAAVSEADITAPGSRGKSLPATDPTRNFVERNIHNDGADMQKRASKWVSAAMALTLVTN